MNVINIKCDNTIVFTNNSNEKEEKSDIWLGVIGRYRYWSYLYFDFTSIPKDINLISAKVVLFKIAPENKYFKRNKDQVYNIVPSIEYVSKYSYKYNTIKTCNSLLVRFEIKEDLSYTEINIINIAKLWIDNTLQNKGVLIRPYKHSGILKLGGAFSQDQWLRPFIELKYEDKQIVNPQIHEPVINLPISIKILS